MKNAVPVARIDDIPPGKSIGVHCHGEDIALFNIDGTFYACSNRCPHAGAPLQDSMIAGTVIACPWHGWRFDLAAGPDAPKDGVIRYPVILHGDDIIVGAPLPAVPPQGEL